MKRAKVERASIDLCHKNPLARFLCLRSDTCWGVPSPNPALSTFVIVTRFAFVSDPESESFLFLLRMHSFSKTVQSECIQSISYILFVKSMADLSCIKRPSVADSHPQRRVSFIETICLMITFFVIPHNHSETRQQSFSGKMLSFCYQSHFRKGRIR